MMSATSSGGVSSIVSLIVSTIWATDISIASRIWSAPTSTERGRPVSRSRPRRVTRWLSHSPGYADPIAILMSSAVRSPRNRLYSRRAYLTMSMSISSPPMRIERETTMPPSEMTATSVVPPPMSTISEPGRLGHRQPGADRGGHRLLDEAGPARAGVERRVADGALLDLGHAGRDAEQHPRPRDQAHPVVHLVHEVLDHLLGHVEVADDPVARAGGSR